jgi:hypothetical protein
MIHALLVDIQRTTCVQGQMIRSKTITQEMGTTEKTEEKLMKGSYFGMDMDDDCRMIHGQEE